MAYSKAELNLLKEEVKKVPIPKYFDKMIVPAKGSYFNSFDLENSHTCECPLHDENTASFRWFPDTNTFFCYGCGEGGDNIKLHTLFVHKQNGNWLSFEQAVEGMKKLSEGMEIRDTGKMSRLSEIKSSTVELMLLGKAIANIERSLLEVKTLDRIETYNDIDMQCMLVDKKLKNALVAKKELESSFKERMEKKENENSN